MTLIDILSGLLGVPYLILYILYRVFITLAVYNSAASKGLSTAKIWTALTGVFGVTSAVVYAIFANVGETKNKSRKKKSIVFALMIAVLIALTVLYTKYVHNSAFIDELYEENASFDKDVVYFTNDDGEDVTYDKMGNEYTYEQYYNNEFKYYSKDGLTYREYSEISEEYDSETYGIMCIETGEKYEFHWGDYAYFIGEDGYLYLYPDDEQCKTYNIYLSENESENMMLDSIYFSKDGKLLYPPDFCNWDKDGNLIFDEGYYYKNFTYDSIPKKQLDWEE